MLRRIADRSGGRYFRATDPEALERIMTEIDPLERTDVRISETRDYRELFPWALIPARRCCWPQTLAPLHPAPDAAVRSR